LDNRRRDGGTNFILMIKEQGTRLTLHEHDNDDDDDDDEIHSFSILSDDRSKASSKAILKHSAI